MHRLSGKIIPALAVLLLAVSLPPTVAETQVWEGRVELDGTHRVSAEDTLVVGPGASVVPAPGENLTEDPSTPARLVVDGRLVVDASRDQPATFTVPIHLGPDRPEPSRLQGARFQVPAVPATCALTVDGTGVAIIQSVFASGWTGACLRVEVPGQGGERVEVRDNRWVDNRVGLQVILEALPRLNDSVEAPTRPVLVTDGNRFTGHIDPGSQANRETGFPASRHVALHVQANGSLPEADPAHEAWLVSRDDTFRDNTLAIRLDPGVRGVRFEQTRIVDNDVGVRATEASGTLDNGRRALFDHAVLDNRAREVYFEGNPYAIAWTGSQIEPSCVYAETRNNEVCVEGAVGRLGLYATLLGIAAVIVTLVTEIGAYAAGRLLFTLRLFSRIDDDELLENQTRAHLLDLVHEQPGQHLKALARQASGYGSTVYHLQRLEKAGYVRSERDGVYRRFYPVGYEGPGIAEPSTRDLILDEIQASPGVHAAEIARRLDLSRQLVSYHVGKLAEGDVVRRETRGGREELYLEEG